MATKIATDYTDKEGYYVEKTLRITAKIATDLTDKDGLKKRLKGKLLPRISRISADEKKTQSETVNYCHGFRG